MIELVLAVYLTLVAASVVGAWRRRKAIDCLPSVVWALMMAIPFVVQKKYFSPFYVGIQAFGVFFVGFTLLFADAAAAWTRQVAKPETDRDGLRLAYGVLGLSLLFQVTHLALMPTVPLLDKWLNKERQTVSLEKVMNERMDLEEAKDKQLSRLAPSSPDAREKALAALAEYRTRIAPVEARERAEIERMQALPGTSSTTRNVLAEFAERLALVQQREKAWLTRAEADLSNPARDTAAALALASHDKSGVRADHQGLIHQFVVKLENVQGDELKLARENASKLLKVPAAFIYACQGLLFFAPAAIIMLFAAGHWFPGAFLLAFSLFYSRASLAKGPLYILVGILLLVGWEQLSPRWKRGVATLVGVVAIPCLLYAGNFIVRNKLSLLNFRTTPEIQARIMRHAPRPLERGEPSFTIPDHYHRLNDWGGIPAYRDARSLTEAEKNINFFIYRGFLSPSEVSHRWYTFYPDVAGKYAGFTGLTPGSRGRPGFQHPANAVGVWAYLNRFPDHFFPSLMAYASVDADAHARWGLTGIVVITLIVVLLRLALARLVMDTVLSRCLYYSALMVIALCLPQASLQAILVAQGLLFYVAALLALKTLALLRAGEPLSAIARAFSFSTPRTAS